MSADLHWMTRFGEVAADVLYGVIPRAPLTAEEWQAVRLVAHRGCANPQHSIYENTLAAFTAAHQAGVWGIELDVQWTMDDWPVVIHDAHTAGLPGVAAVEINRTELNELQTLCPLVPRLEEVLEQFAGQLHLMIELKGSMPNSTATKRLQACLSKWQPVVDYHLMSLAPLPLRALEDYPVAAKLLIAITNTQLMFAEFQRGGFGGLTGHFLLLNARMRRQLETLKAPWGTGYVNSMNLLAREIRSGTEWIFSNVADELLRGR